jgi:lysozyme
VFSIQETEKTLEQLRLNQNQYDALVSLVYNIGGTAFKKSTMYSMLLREQYEEAAKQFPLWDHAGGRVLAGLSRRRAVEKALFLKPI